MRLVRTPTIPRPRVPHRRFVRVSTETAAPPRHPGLYENEPNACRRSLRRFLPVLAQLGLLVAITKVYRLEGRALFLLMTVALAALPVHYLLPYRWKKPAFIAASVIGLGWVFGLRTTLIVLPAAGLLIGLALAPIAWRWKAGSFAALAVGLALARAELFSWFQPPAAVWPLLGTMFMFRMIIFLYELKHADRPESPLDALSYFFLLPNYCFLHFPVVDYRTMQRGYFAEDVHDLQHRGLRMMLIGVIHLLVYRLVYHELLITPDQVDGPARLVGLLVFNYLLYLHVSGQFHIACGMLHLFGYRLPETHHRFLLATGFTDYWRRINIYWKDFMVRVVFNPVVFRLKRRPQWQALAAATAVVFVATWFLHAYQSFWLSGAWGFSLPDALFWGILGGLVLINVQLDARRSAARARARRAAGQDEPAFIGIFIKTLKIAACFSTISLLWSLWTSESLSSWLSMIARGLNLA